MPLPNGVYGRLNTDQILALKLVEEYGWSMKFMRRPIDQEPTYVLFNNTTQQYAVLDEDGTINRESGIKIRNVSPAKSRAENRISVIAPVNLSG